MIQEDVGFFVHSDRSHGKTGLSWASLNCSFSRHQTQPRLCPFSLAILSNRLYSFLTRIFSVAGPLPSSSTRSPSMLVGAVASPVLPVPAGRYCTRPGTAGRSAGPRLAKCPQNLQAAWLHAGQTISLASLRELRATAVHALEFPRHESVLFDDPRLRGRHPPDRTGLPFDK